MRRLLILAPALLAGCAPQSHEAIMAEIESKVVMPEGTPPLDHYARYYAMRSDGSVVGEYISGGFREKPGRQWVEFDKLPLVYDGGCSVVTITYDPRWRIVSRPRCNGYA